MQNGDVGEEITSAMEKIILDTIGEEVHLSEKTVKKQSEVKGPEKPEEKQTEEKEFSQSLLPLMKPKLTLFPKTWDL